MAIIPRHIKSFTRQPVKLFFFLDFKTVKRDKWHAKQSANARYVCRVGYRPPNCGGR